VGAARGGWAGRAGRRFSSRPSAPGAVAGPAGPQGFSGAPAGFPSPEDVEGIEGRPWRWRAAPLRCCGFPPAPGTCWGVVLAAASPAARRWSFTPCRRAQAAGLALRALRPGRALGRPCPPGKWAQGRPAGADRWSSARPGPRRGHPRAPKLAGRWWSSTAHDRKSLPGRGAGSDLERLDRRLRNAAHTGLGVPVCDQPRPARGVRDAWPGAGGGDAEGRSSVRARPGWGRLLMVIDRRRRTDPHTGLYSPRLVGTACVDSGRVHLRGSTARAGARTAGLSVCWRAGPMPRKCGGAAVGQGPPTRAFGIAPGCGPPKRSGCMPCSAARSRAGRTLRLGCEAGLRRRVARLWPGPGRWARFIAEDPGTCPTEADPGRGPRAV